MKDAYTFQPEQGHGLAFHAAAILVLAFAGAVGLWQAAHATIGPVFLAYLLPALFALGLSPALVYRAYALYRANYELLRDGIRLRWGLRAVDIPMDAVSWVRPAGELDQALPLPWLRWPGAILGTRHLPGGGQVEFLASVPDRLVLISTPERIYAVSPDDPETFLRTFRRFTELGSLTPLPARSIYPGFLLARVWDALPARVLLLCALAYGKIKTEDWEGVMELCHQQIELYTPLENRIARVYTVPLYPQALLGAGRADEAARFIEDFMATAGDVQADFYLAIIQRVLGQALAALGRHEQARLALDTAVDRLEAQGSRLELARALQARSLLLGQLGEQAAWQADLARARGLFEECGVPSAPLRS